MKLRKCRANGSLVLPSCSAPAAFLPLSQYRQGLFCHVHRESWYRSWRFEFVARHPWARFLPMGRSRVPCGVNDCLDVRRRWSPYCRAHARMA